MLVAEALIRKDYLEEKIKDIKSYLFSLKGSNLPDSKKNIIYTEGIKKIFGLLKDLQVYKISIRKVNASTIINLAGADVVLSDALSLLATVENKITLLDDIIGGNDLSIDFFNLIDTRDQLLEEQAIMLSAIKASDWSTEIE